MTGITINRRSKRILFHILFWISFTVFNYFISVVQNFKSDLQFLDSIAKYSIAAFIFYGTAFFILPVSFAKKKYVLSGILILMMSLASFILKAIIYYKILTAAGFIEPPYTMLEFFFTNIWWWFQYTLFGFGYWYATEAIKKEKALRAAEQIQLQTEKEKLALENAHLRAQINPHFLFNTLGYFYNQISDSHPKVADGIIALTEIMRSAIRKPDKEGKVPLQDEVASIEYLLQIYQLRYDNGVHIEFNKQGDYSGLSILPHILITLVENALKHGDIHDEAHPLTIWLSVSDSDLHFQVYNRKKFSAKDPSHGIGIHYLKSQLIFAYKESFSFDIEDEPTHYTTNFRISKAALHTSPALLLNEQL